MLLRSKQDGRRLQKRLLGQCGRATIPNVLIPNNFKNIIENIEKYDIVLLLYEGEQNLTLKSVLIDFKQRNKSSFNIAIIVGPEGGFDESEVEVLKECSNVKCVTLGKNILRTETAGMAAVSMINYEFEL